MNAMNYKIEKNFTMFPTNVVRNNIVDHRETHYKLDKTGILRSHSLSVWFFSVASWIFSLT